MICEELKKQKESGKCQSFLIVRSLSSNSGSELLRKFAQLTDDYMGMRVEPYEAFAICITCHSKFYNIRVPDDDQQK